ncbi:acyltransferase family protein [Microbacterium sp. P02]|uniref:acyltransferase family protein n=1 Tax=Microbacterium sp. P02 TaxID=3366260 RepID=UPI00366D0DB0
MTAAPPADAGVRSLAPSRRPRVFRTDIQALRAIAILAVLLNHLWPLRLTGGYIGVDVFFVISGFLITSHLVKEAAATGRIRLASFYARRIRRLLPAALLVLTVSGIATALFLPYPRWERAGGEIIASAAYVENWFLAAISVDYSALNDSATVAQHYWSLSVEEQFYLLWPVVILGGWVWALRSKRVPRAVVSLSLAVVALLSLAASAYVTVAAPSPAYFVTYARVWEFAAGGLVALLASDRRLPAVFANVLSLGGLAAIAVAAFTFDADTAFPGFWALVPVLGTAAVIVAGMDGRAQWHSVITATRPVQWLGDVSYSLYLWHWPLIVVIPFALVLPLSTTLKIGILVASLVLAWLTKKFVEDRGQRWPWLVASARRTFAAMLIGIGAVVAVGLGLLWGHAAMVDQNRPSDTVASGPCVGPSALDPSAECANPFGPATSVVMGPQNEYFYAPPECGAFESILSYGDKRTTTPCDFSGGNPDAPRVWLVGDSHAQQWQGAIFDLARERGWNVTTSYFGGCPAVDAPFIGFRTPWVASEADVCREWSQDVADEIEATAPEFVFTSSAGRNQLVDDGSDRPQLDQFVDGLKPFWSRWADAGSTVIALGNVPYNAEVRSPDCVALNPADPIECAAPRNEAQPPDPYLLAARAMDRSDVVGIDFDSAFCDERLCYAVVGSVPVYYDADHLNLEYVRLLAPRIDDVLNGVGL